MNYRRILYAFISALLFIQVACEPDNFSLEKSADEFFFLENKDALMPVWVQGNTASNIFLIHVHGGPGGESIFSFNIAGDSFTDPLEERYANVYYDQRASGSSQGTTKKEHITEEQFTEDLFKLVMLLKTKYGRQVNIYLIGTSWGGRLAAQFLLNPTYQKEVKGWISVAGSIDIVTTANSGKNMLARHADSQLTIGNNLKDWTKILTWTDATDSVTNENQWKKQNNLGWLAMELLDDSLHHETKISTGDVLKGLFFSPVNFSSVLVQNGSFDEHYLDLFNNLETELNKIQVPSILMAGKYDFVVPPEVAIQAYNNVGSTSKELIIFNYSGHLIPFNETTRFVNEVVRFIETNR